MRFSGLSIIGVGLPVLALALALGATAGSGVDGDGDTVPDRMDNCLVTRNGAGESPNNQCDTDRDGYGNACDADFNNDFGVGIPDFGTLIQTFGKSGHPINSTDTNCDTVVGIPDFGTFTAYFGTSVGQSGLSCAGTTPCP